MSESSTSTRYGEHYFLMEKRNGLTCDECGEIFEKPVLATFSSGGSSKTYYACPRCLTKIRDAASSKNDESRKAFTVVQKAKCAHFLGFLKKRSKNMPIPDECLTCERMIECLTQ